MSITKDPYSLYFPIKLGSLNISIFISENLYAVEEECLSEPHSHHIYELRFIESGHCTLFINGERLTACGNDLILVHPSEYHYQMLHHETHEISQYTIRFRVESPTQSSPPHQLRAYKSFMKHIRSVRLVHDEKHSLSTLFQKLKDDISQKPIGYIYNLQSLTALILTEFLRYANLNTEAIFPTEDIKYRGSLISKTEQFFSFKHMHDVKIQELADDIKLSTRQAARILQQIYGMSFSQKLTEIRLQHAAYYLTHTDLNMEEISTKCGFNNSSYFYMSFRKMYDMTPSEFRKNNKLISNAYECFDPSSNSQE